MKVQFKKLTAEALTHRSLLPQTPVALFEVEDGTEGTVLAEHVNLFSDVDLVVATGRVRENLLLALCSGVRRANWAEVGIRTLALHKRFTVEPDKDEPRWSVRGFNSIQNVDLHLIKHVLGVGEEDLDSEERWSRLLGISLERRTLLSQLERLGCVEWKRLATDEDPDVERPISIYWGLSRSVRASCIQLLAHLRERYMELAFETIRATAHIRNARHIHLGPDHSSVMHFLDDAGTTVIAKGGRQALAISTAFSALAENELVLGPATLRKRRARIIHDFAFLSGNMNVHTPLTWRMTT